MRSCAVVLLAAALTGCSGERNTAGSGDGMIAGQYGYYAYADGRIQIILLFDDHIGEHVSACGGGVYLAGFDDGSKFEVVFDDQQPRSVKINDQEYSFDDGRLFLCSVREKPFAVEQIPISFPPQQADASIRSLVVDAVTKSKDENEAVREFAETAVQP